MDGYSLELLRKNVLHIGFVSQKRMGLTLLRFQEHYECEAFKGKVFTVPEFQAWYATQGHDKPYELNYEGFNLPDTAFTPFIMGEFDPLSVDECWLLDTIACMRSPFYVIASVQGDEETLEHELAHALYYTDASYRACVDEALRAAPLGNLVAFLRKRNYHADAHMDEANAFLATDVPYLKEKGVDLTGLEQTIAMLSELYRQAKEQK
jgi:hypothetical protein